MVFTRYLRKEEEESILLQVLTNQTKGKSLYTTTSKDSTSPLTCFKFNKTHTSHHPFMSTQTHLWAPFPKIKIFLSSGGSNSSVYLLLCQRILQSWRLGVLVHHHVLLNTETKQKMRIRKSKLELFEDSLSSPCLPASFHTQAQRIWTVIERSLPLSPMTIQRTVIVKGISLDRYSMPAKRESGCLWIFLKLMVTPFNPQFAWIIHLLDLF